MCRPLHLPAKAVTGAAAAAAAAAVAVGGGDDDGGEGDGDGGGALFSRGAEADIGAGSAPAAAAPSPPAAAAEPELLFSGVCVHALRPQAAGVLAGASASASVAAESSLADAPLALALSAPEWLLGAERVSCASTLVWSLGVLLHLLLTGEPPVAADTAPELLQAIFSGGRPHPRLSAATAAFLSSLLRPEPLKRARAADALGSAWLGLGHDAVYSEAHLRDGAAQHAPRALLHALHARLQRRRLDEMLARCRR